MKVCRIFIYILLLSLITLTPRNSQGQEYIYADVFGLTTNAMVSGALEMGIVSGKTGLYLIPYYLRVQFPPQNFTAWGIQIYTNNCINHTWISTTGVYNGLRGKNDIQLRVPLYWQAYDTPQSLTNTVGGLAFNMNTLPQYWGLIRDRNDEDIAVSWLTNANLLDRTFISYTGLGKYPNMGRTSIKPPVYLYLGMDVRDVKETEQFTGTLNLDFYNLAVDLNKGGYATPNPFVPTRGQKAFFNFYLNDINSSFIIRIFTIRGRLIKTLTQQREWDGRKENGEIVEGGLYIYQIEAENKRVSGSVVLIK
jgi:hypothetical protein